MIIRLLALIAGIAAATLVCGCCSSGPRTAGANASVGFSLPSLSELFTGPPHPVCVPKDGCVVAYGDEWKILGPCGEQAPKAAAMVSMPAATLERVMRVQPDRVDPKPEPVGEGKVIRRIVTTYEGGIPNVEDATPVPAAAGDCP